MKQHVQVHRLYFIIGCPMVQQPADMILLPARARAGRECAGDDSYGLGSSPRNLFLACSRLPLRSAHARLSRVDLGPIHWSLLPHGMAAPTPITADANKPKPTVRRRKANSAAAVRWWCASCQFKAHLTLPDKMLDPAEWLPIFPLSPRGKWSPASPPWLAVVRPRHQRPRGATKLVSSGMVKSNHTKSAQGHAVFPCRL